MNKIFLPFFLLQLTFFTATAQTAFQSTYGIGSGTDVKTTSDKGFIVLGYAEGSTDVITLAKTDSLGNHQWSRSYYSTGTNTLSGNAIAQTNDNGYVIAGTLRYSASGDSDLVLLKLDSTGVLLWNRNFNFGHFEYCTDVLQMNDGGFLVMGNTNGISVMVKTDSSGTFVWAKRFNWSVPILVINSVLQTSDSGLIMAGYIERSSAGWMNDVSVIKTASDGTIQWSKAYGYLGAHHNDYGSAIVQTADGGYAVAGGTDNYGAGQRDAYLLKLTSVGSLQWTRTFGGTDIDEAYDLEQSQDGGFILAGYTKSFGNGGADAYLLKTASDGTLQWSSTFGGAGDDQAYALAKASDGGYILNGFTQSGFATYNPDMYFIKTDGAGHTGCNESFPVTLENTGGMDDTLWLTQTDLTSTGALTIFTQFGSVPNRLCTMSIAEVDNQSSFDIFPNPFTASATIQPEMPFKNATIVIFDACGQAVRTDSHISGSAYTLQRGNLPAGWYTVQVQDKHSVFRNKKLGVAD